MKNKKWSLVYLLAILSLSYCVCTSSSGGVFGQSTAGCGGGGCHQNSPATLLNVTGIPITGYVNGTAYTMTLTVSNPGKSKAGFNLTVNNGSLTAGAGMNSNGTTELKHSAPLTMVSNTATWTFTWTAPATGTAPVIFFVAGNAVDGNNQSSNDEFDTNQFSFNAAAAATAPTITNVSAAGTGPNTGAVNANVNANGDASSINIEYGLTASYGNSIVGNPAVVTGNTPTPISGNITGLAPATLYHYRVVAMNTMGTTYSPDATFTTLSASVSSLQETTARIYPNPVSDQLFYRDEKDLREVQFLLCNALGMPCSAIVKKITPGQYALDLSSLAPGIYSLLIDKEGQRYLQPVLKR